MFQEVGNPSYTNGSKSNTWKLTTGRTCETYFKSAFGSPDETRLGLQSTTYLLFVYQDTGPLDKTRPAMHSTFVLEIRDYLIRAMGRRKISPPRPPMLGRDWNEVGSVGRIWDSVGNVGRKSVREVAEG
ncbi:polynucleotidyl transferase [Striga asiatica]|uniref:Polynucleotidyl transferase n=1 Tax=Striga asiatica TaxID=4170 RepID=A0A5A7PLP4_STRAF|nr:polynucleotidyl transferase [Striga asiatica]